MSVNLSIPNLNQSSNFSFVKKFQDEKYHAFVLKSKKIDVKETTTILFDSASWVKCVTQFNQDPKLIENPEKLQIQTQITTENSHQILVLNLINWKKDKDVLYLIFQQKGYFVHKIHAQNLISNLCSEKYLSKPDPILEEQITTLRETDRFQIKKQMKFGGEVNLSTMILKNNKYIYDREFTLKKIHGYMELIDNTYYWIPFIKDRSENEKIILGLDNEAITFFFK